MIKKNLTWTDFNDVKHNRDWYFHLSKSEVIEEILALGGTDGEDIQAKIQAIIDTGDMKKVMATFKDLLERSVGHRSADGSKFKKSEEIRSEFMDSGAYDELFMWMVTNPFEAGKFIQGMLPNGVITDEAVKEEMARRGISKTEEVQLPATDWKPEEPKPLDDSPVTHNDGKREYTRQQLLDMSNEDFYKLVGTDPRKMPKPLLELAYLRRSGGASE